MTSGIYRIYNRLNHKNYIGQSRDVYRRIRTHMRLLSKGEHHSSKLQADYDRFGIGAFRFEILEYCEPRELNKKEAHYIKQFNAIRNGYNTLPVIVKPELQRQAEPERKAEPIQEMVKEEVAPQKVQAEEVKEVEANAEWSLRDLLEAIKANHMRRLIEELGAIVSPVQVLTTMVLSTLVSLSVLYLYFTFMTPGLIIATGVTLFLVISMMITFDHGAWRNTKEVKKLLHFVFSNVYGVWFSLFYLVFCIYLLWTDDPVTKEFNLYIMCLMSITLLLLSASNLLYIGSVVFKPKIILAWVNGIGVIKRLVKLLTKAEKKLDEKLEELRKSEYGSR